MHNYFVSCFWGKDPLRIKLCEEFCNRYPNVILLQNGNSIDCKNTIHFNFTEDGFIDYKMINAFLKLKTDVLSLTIIDSDLLLPDNFFIEVAKKHSCVSVPNFLTVKNNYEIIGGSIYFRSSSMVQNYLNNGVLDGHTGFVLSFNHHFLKGYNFPEYFIHGGFDYFITNAILGRCMTKFKSEYFKVPKCLFSYIPVDVAHFYHGPVKDRLTKWENY